MKLISRLYFLSILLVFLASCNSRPATLPTEILVSTTISPSHVSTSTSIPVAITSSPLPTQPIIPMITPDPIQVERWKEYEKALAKKLLAPNSLQGEGLCEWELLGRADQSIYVWAFCQSPPYSESLPPSIASIPAVIHLGVDGDVQSVEIPGSGSAYAPDVRKMFPVEIQELIFSHSIDTSRMGAHINSRRKNPEPPLIVLSATPTP